MITDWTVFLHVAISWLVYMLFGLLTLFFFFALLMTFIENVMRAYYKLKEEAQKSRYSSWLAERANETKAPKHD